MTRYFLDRDGDLWVELADGTYDCIVQVAEFLSDEAPGQDLETMTTQYGPLTELVAKQ